MRRDPRRNPTCPLVHDNAYGFHFFQSGTSFESFPSGHAAVAAAALSILWILYPNTRCCKEPNIACWDSSRTQIERRQEGPPLGASQAAGKHAGILRPAGVLARIPGINAKVQKIGGGAGP